MLITHKYSRTHCIYSVLAEDNPRNEYPDSESASNDDDSDESGDDDFRMQMPKHTAGSDEDNLSDDVDIDHTEPAWRKYAYDPGLDDDDDDDDV